MFKQALRRMLPPLLAVLIMPGVALLAAPLRARQPSVPPSIIHPVQADNDRMEMTVNTSRRLTLDRKIPEAQVNNPDILELTPLSPNMIQISAKSPGVTQVNLWDEDGKIYTIDVVVFADAQELTMLLKSQFPNAALRVVPVGTNVLISGFVDQPEHVSKIIQIAEEYYPKVINNITISGVQEVLLHVKVMEVSRTKLRTLGFDFAKITGPNLLLSSVSGLLDVTGTTASSVTTTISGDKTFNFHIIEPGGSFFGVLEALREDKLAKILADPNLVAISGRPAFFRVGGEFGYQLNGGITGPSVEFKEFGTRLDFVAIVLGNGRIRLEVRPQVSEIDVANSVQGIPALKIREVETGVELKAGQTLAIAGLVQTRIEAQNRGLPWISEVPYLGVPFRRVEEQNNEVELLILVTPELVEAMDAHEVPLCGPGMRTTSPSDWELFFSGHLEVPNCCPPCPATGGPQGLPLYGPSPAALPPGGLIIEQHEQVQPPQPLSTGAVRARPGGRVSAVSQNRHSPSKPYASGADSRSGRQKVEPGFIGPIGYDVVK